MDTAGSWNYTEGKTGVWTGASLGWRFSFALCLLYSQSILSAAFYDLAGWGPFGYTCITR